MKQYVRNSVVKMDWEVEGFFETRADGFVGAAQEYETPTGTHTVVFKDNISCFLIDEETGNPATREEVMQAFKELLDSGDLDLPLEDSCADSYCEIGIQGCLTNEETLDNFEFTQAQKDDIIKRMDDLAQYFVTEVTDM